MALKPDAFHRRVLTLDIETSPVLTYTFDMRPKWISPDKIVEPSRVLMVGAKWYGEPGKVFSEFDYRRRRVTDDKHQRMLEDTWAAMDRAEAIVTWNGNRFDFPRLNWEFQKAGMPRPRPYKSIDLFAWAKRSIKAESLSLNYIAKQLGVGQKVQHNGFDLWRRVLAGDPAAWREMENYCDGDLEVTEGVYDRQRGHLPSHPFIGPGEGMRCNQCGTQITAEDRVGHTRAVVLDYPLYRCPNPDCGGLIKSGHTSGRAATTRGVN